MPREGQSRNAISKMRHSRTKRADSVWLPENKEQTTNNANTHMLSTLGNGRSLGGAASMSSTLENYSLVEAAGMSSLPGGVQSFADSTTQSYKPSVEKQKTRTKGKIGPNQKKTATGPAHGNYGKTKNKIHKSRLSNASITANDRPLLRAQFNHSTTDTTEDWSCKHCPFTKRVGKTTKEGKTTSKGFTASWSRKHLTGVGKGTVSLCPNIPKELKATIVAAAPKKK